MWRDAPNASRRSRAPVSRSSASVSATARSVWTSIRDPPLLAEGVVWLLGFQFVIGLAILQASWEEPVRLVVIDVLAVAYTYMFLPRARKR
jgi:hypothetical protein